MGTMMARGKPSVVALLRSPQGQQVVDEALTAAGISVHATVGELRRFASRLTGGRMPDVLLLDVDLDDGAELQALEDMIRRQGSAAAIVVTAANATLDGARRLMRLGIMDILPQPIIAQEAVAAVRTALDRLPRRAGTGETGRPAPGTVLGFLKAGGGMGGTSLLVQSACALARRGGKARVCVLDFDLQFGCAGLYLDLPPRATMLDLLRAADRLDGSLLRTSLAHHAAGIDVLTAPQAMQPLDVVPTEAVLRLVAVARQEYDHVLIDLPQAWTEWTREVLAASDGAVLVMQLTVSSIRQARRQIETIIEEGLDHVLLSVIANRVQKGLFRKGVSTKDAAKAIDRAIDEVVFTDYEAMSKAINVGLPVAEVKGGRPLARQISQVIARIAERTRAARGSASPSAATAFGEVTR